MEEFKKNVSIRGKKAYAYAKAHLDEEDVTYPRHCGETMLQAGKATLAILAYTVHALLPFLVPQAGNDIIAKLAETNQRKTGKTVNDKDE